MKLTSVLIVAATFSLCSETVRSQEQPKLSVAKYSWVKERIGWEGNPLSATIENASEARERVRTERRVRSPLEERLEKARKDEQKGQKEPARYVFNYKITVENSSLKAVKEIDWDYIFSDPVTGELLGRHEFTSVVKIGAGKRKDLSVRASSPPTQTISVYKLGENEGAGLSQSIVVLRVLYEDGSEWKAN